MRRIWRKVRAARLDPSPGSVPSPRDITFSAMSPTRTTVAVVQAEVSADLAAGLARTREVTIEASKSGATLVVFPETWLPGYPAWLDVSRDVALWDHPPVKQVFARMAEHSVVVEGETGR